MITIDDFKKVELKIGRVESVEEIRGSKNLYKLIVDFGNEKRQIVSGIKKYYKPEELKNKKFVFVTNLKHTKIMGEVSEGMILAANDGDKIVLLTIEKDISEGSSIS